MSDERWIEVQNDFNSAAKHFKTAQKIFGRRTPSDDDEQGHFYALAFMHAMQAGHTSLESGMLRVMRLVGEVPPAGDDWHADVVKRMGAAIDGKRPIFLPANIMNAVDQTRRFRHVAAHTYDDFNWEGARRPVEAAAEIADSIAGILQNFRERLDPSGEDGSGGAASGGPRVRPG